MKVLTILKNNHQNQNNLFSRNSATENSAKEEYFADLSKITKATVITLAGNFVGKSIFFAYTLFIANCLGADVLGLYCLALALVQFLAVLANLGMNIGVTRFVAIFNERQDQPRLKGTVLATILLTLFSSVTFAAALVLLADFLSTSVFHKPELKVALAILALSIPFDCLMHICLASTRGLKFMHYTVYIENLTAISLRFVFAFFLVCVLQMGLKGVTFAYLLSSMVSSVLAFHYANKHFRLVDSRTPAIFEVTQLLRFAVPMLFSELLYNLSRRIDILMLGFFVSTAGIGIYSVAQRLLVIVDALFQAFRPILNPFVAALHYKADIDRLSDILKVITRWALTLSFPVFLSLFFFPSFFLSFFGTEFMQGTECLTVLLVGNFFGGVSALSDSVLFMSGRSDLCLKNNIFIICFNTLLNYLLIPKFGILGAAYATGMSLFLISLFRLSEVYLFLKIHQFRKDLWKPLTAGLVAICSVLILQNVVSSDSRLFVILLLIMLFTLHFALICLLKLAKEEIYIKRIIIGRVLSLVKQ